MKPVRGRLDPDSPGSSTAGRCRVPVRRYDRLMTSDAEPVERPAGPYRAGEVDEALGVVLEALRILVARQPEVGQALVVLAQELVASCHSHAPVSTEGESAEAKHHHADEPEQSQLLDVDHEALEALKKLELPAILQHQVEAPRSHPEQAPAEIEPGWRSARVDLELVARRAQLKAQALDWALRRRGLLQGSCEFKTEIKPHDDRLIAEARSEQECFLWMLMPNGHQDRMSEEDLELLAGCYRAVALAAGSAHEYMQASPELPDERSLSGFLLLAAEAQSALAKGLSDLGTGKDKDQRDLWTWLRQATDRHNVFLDRFMSREVPASPADLHDYPERLGSYIDEFRSRLGREKNRRGRLNRLKYHVERIERALIDDSDPGDSTLAHDWRVITNTVSDWVSDGDQVTDGRLLEALASVSGEIPQDLVTGHVVRVAEEVERWLDARSEKFDEEESETGPDEGPRDIGSAVKSVCERFPGRITIALNKRSNQAHPYTRPVEVERALEWLATVYWEVRMGMLKGQDHRALNHGLLETCGWFYRPRQSPTTMGRYPDWYRCSFNGRALELEEHIGRGNAKRQGEDSIRIAFAWDARSSLVVVGFIGQHQKTTQS